MYVYMYICTMYKEDEVEDEVDVPGFLLSEPSGNVNVQRTMLFCDPAMMAMLFEGDVFLCRHALANRHL